MDTKKIGAFLKQCRKEKNLTQEQLAEKFGVSARTVSRWETGINMPDLSVLVQLAEYYDVEMRELLDGERSQTMNKDMKETLDKVAVYEEWVKQKALKAGNLAFASMFVIGVFRCNRSINFRVFGQITNRNLIVIFASLIDNVQPHFTFRQL